MTLFLNSVLVLDVLDTVSNIDIRMTLIRYLLVKCLIQKIFVVFLIILTRI